MKKSSTLLLLCVLGSFLSACIRPLRLPDQELVDTKRVLATTSELADQRKRLSGRFQIRATGLKQFFGHADVILALQKPSSFYLSIPSFFESPARVVTCDGKDLYLLDMSTESPSYVVRPASAQLLNEWIGIPIEAHEFVEGLLGIVELKNKIIKSSDISKRHRRYSLVLQISEEKTKEIEFDADTDDILSQSVFTKGSLTYRVKYSDFREFEGTRFSGRIEVSIRGNEKVDFQITPTEMSFPKEEFDEETFQIEEP